MEVWLIFELQQSNEGRRGFWSGDLEELWCTTHPGSEGRGGWGGGQVIVPSGLSDQEERAIMAFCP